MQESLESRCKELKTIPKLGTQYCGCPGRNCDYRSIHPFIYYDVNKYPKKETHYMCYKRRQ